MKKNISKILVGAVALVVAVAIVSFVKIGESLGIIIKEILIPAVVISVVLTLVFALFNYFEEITKRKDNIAQLKLLSRKLFDSFNNLVKEGGLLEEAWTLVFKGDVFLDAKFRDMLKDAREIMVKENMERALVIFELEADDILSGKGKVSLKRLDYCETAAFSRITNLLGVDCAKMEFLELATLLCSPFRVCARVVENDLALRILDNRVDISPFQSQIERNREILLASEPSANQGVLQIVDEIALIINAEGR
ncbi:MAG: hypothetical protein UR82_C0052G0014 [Candidatus Moranbacteria bacterium GW2011_GWF1_35_5]|nr:MAG: hypothetical protein UR82_C0052G0014 [Candidatus Moranbacteria bacterium GW2011_GWF1_35_5]